MLFWKWLEKLTVNVSFLTRNFQTRGGWKNKELFFLIDLCFENLKVRRTTWEQSSNFYSLFFLMRIFFQWKTNIYLLSAQNWTLIVHFFFKWWSLFFLNLNCTFIIFKHESSCLEIEKALEKVSFPLILTGSVSFHANKENYLKIFICKFQCVISISRTYLFLWVCWP